MSGGVVYRRAEVLRLERDPHADMHAPEQPYRLTLWDPATNVHDPEEPHACRNLSLAEVEALRDLCSRLLAAEETPHAAPVQINPGRLCECADGGRIAPVLNCRSCGGSGVVR
ncbi:hypothetical protein [Deinococcus murrayi]|uniref:hypothetical protein n=1 Tax=Deinococcus murrayi TaxID=68910 RepID=UPI00048612EA|nr:hypothetical protein [Deinococcus murrayi]